VGELVAGRDEGAIEAGASNELGDIEFGIVVAVGESVGVEGRGLDGKRETDG